MSQQYGGPPGGPGPQGQPPYGQPPQYGQPQPGAYQQPPPQYGQPQPGVYQQPPPQYGQPQPGPGGPPQPNQVMQNLQATAPQVPADAYERTLSLLVYVWLLFFGLGSLIVLRNLGTVGFSINLDVLRGLVLPIIVMFAVKEGQLARFHAKQALYLAIAFIILEFVVGLLRLIPNAGVQENLVDGGLIGLLRIIFSALALFAGVRAFANRELYRIPVIGSFVR